ncbi:MAG: UDP-N-acetylmuramate dehydrogenase [Candidatus Omnitrophica bacterium]|nr:UDP-N-acetylmuramate dehydrogenase [Candidatus Omnitrophota bacterium]
MLWPKSLSKRIKTKVNLSAYTSFKIGGQAQYFFEPEGLKSLQQALILARHAGMRVFILGLGSNVLVSDAGLDGLVIRLNRKFFQKCICRGNFIVAGGGLKLNKLIVFSGKNKLSGVEFLTGIPGTLGGALLGNAGAWGQSIGALANEIGVLDYSGKFRILSGKQLKFSYRSSNLNKYVIIWARLRLLPGKKNEITAKIREYLRKRKQAQNNRLPNAGCIFKNPGKDSAGKLIDACGLKGRRVGKAVISESHANFILNAKGAKSRDVLSLMDLIQKKVKEKFKVGLEPEIKIWK